MKFLLAILLLLASASAQTTFYGEQIGADGLNNSQVANVDVDMRFRASTTSTVISLIWYNIAVIHSCPPISGGTYGCGTGGTMHISIQTDDGTPSHLPTGTELCSVDDVQPITNGRANTLLTDTFTTHPTLTAGTLYHIHWHNTDASPTSNFVSVDNEYVWDATVPRQPTIPDTDLAVFRGSTLQPNDTPIFQLAYGNSVKQGQGYMENWITNAPFISGLQRVREQFTVSGSDITVSSVSLRMARDSTNTGSSPLTVTLETGTGTPIEQGTIPATSFPVGTRLGASTDHNAWATLNFTATHKLLSGQSYHLVLSAPSDTIFHMEPIRRGPSYGFVPPTFFGDGFGQFSTDGGGTWSGFNQPGGSTNNTNADMQFFFAVVPGGSIPPAPTGFSFIVR